MVYEATREWYHGLVGRLNQHTGSGLLCQVVVLNAMKPRRLSPKVILQISLWSVIIIVLAFIALYSFLLTYMNRHIIEARLEYAGNHLKNSRNSKVRLRSKVSNTNLHNMNAQNKTLFMKQSNNSLKLLWKLDLDDVFSIRPKCYNKTALLTILITSAPTHFQQRVQIRKTWCNALGRGEVTGGWQCVFLLGQTDSWQVEQAVDQEAQDFHDILRGTYYDSYRNLTVKVVHGLHWSSNSCRTPYTLKTDDDCFVNVLQLHSFLTNHNKITNRLYVGNIYYLMEKRKVIRNTDNKWSVPVEKYALDYYPPYASGSGYVLSQDIVQAIVMRSPYIQPIPNEDAYIGIVMNSLGVDPVSSDRFTLFSVGLRLCNYLYVLVSHGVKPEDQQTHHDSMVRAVKECPGSAEAMSSWS